MGDRAALQLYVYDCPPGQVGAVLDIIEEHGLSRDWGALPRDPDNLHLGDVYTIEEISLGADEEISSALTEKAPGASFQCWQDPKYEYSGVLHIYTPELGHFTADCDSNGTPVFSPEDIKRWIDESAPSMPVAHWLADVWPRRTGRLWTDALAEKQPNQAVLQRETPA